MHYEKDELDQLEKMYEADDLTEETEEIVLKRQRNSVEFAEFSLENARLSRDETLNIRLPRYDISIKETLERTALAEARAQMALSLDLNRARYELEQRKKARTKSLDRHAKLLEDRGLMEIKSPADGIVFYGQSVNGRWSDTATLINKYKPQNNVSPDSVLMTIVESRPLYVTSTVDEGKRPDVSDGQKAKIALPAEGADRVAGEVKSISPIPVSPGKFEINFDLAQDEIPDWIVPGMSCKVQIMTYDKKDALVVPKTAVRDDEDDEDKKYVWLVDPDDEEAKPERRNVKLGKRKGDDVEIVKGLKKGDVISLDDEADKGEEGIIRTRSRLRLGPIMAVARLRIQRMRSPTGHQLDLSPLLRRLLRRCADSLAAHRSPRRHETETDAVHPSPPRSRRPSRPKSPVPSSAASSSCSPTSDPTAPGAARKRPRASTSTPRRPALTTPFEPAVTSLVVMALIEAEPNCRRRRAARNRQSDRPRRRLARQAPRPTAARHARCALQRLGPRLLHSSARQAARPRRRRRRAARASGKSTPKPRPTCWSATASSAAAGRTTTEVAGTQTPATPHSASAPPPA